MSDEQRDRFICGYIRLTTSWFQGDPEASFSCFLYASTETRLVEFHPKFRAFWKSCIRPCYSSRLPKNLQFHDFKSNPRRCHPFATCVYDWYLQVQSFAQSYNEHEDRKTIPILILKPCRDRFEMPLQWRDGFLCSVTNEILTFLVFDASKCIAKIQKLWRLRRHWKKEFKKCIDQIENEVAYEYGKYKMDIVKEHFLQQSKRLHSCQHE